MIKAEVHTDDHVEKANFDATEWFAQATDEQIMELARCGWGGDYPSDDIALWFENLNPAVAAVFAYLGQIQKKETMGFECHIDPDDAKHWISVNRQGFLLNDVEEVEA